MLLGSYVKQNVDEWTVDVGLASFIGGRAYGTITPTVVVPAGMTNLSTLVSGTDIQIMPAGGTDLTGYRFVINVAIVIGGLTHKVQAELDVIINNTPDVYTP